MGTVHLRCSPTKILVVDDSALFRQSLQNILRELPDIIVVGTAKDGVDALDKIDSLDPDLLTLDIQMPDMDGIGVLREIKRRKHRPKAIMVSGLTSQGAQITTDALLEGAFDFILKPCGSDSQANRQQLKDALQDKILAFRETSTRSKQRKPAGTLRTVRSGDVLEPTPKPSAACEAVLIGTSTGGPEALRIVLSRLSADLSVPVLVVQHMPAQYTRSLAKRLDEVCALQVVEAEDMTIAVAGRVILAAGGQQMKLEKVGNRYRVRLTDDPPEHGVRPSVDYLIRSAASVLHSGALAVIMTGMGRDGLEGCRRIKALGGCVFAQAQDDCVVYGMPKAVVDAELADRILPLGKIAPAIARHVKRSHRS